MTDSVLCVPTPSLLVLYRKRHDAEICLIGVVWCAIVPIFVPAGYITGDRNDVAPVAAR